MEGNLCTLEVRVHGRPVHEYHQEGKTYIEGRKDSEFTLRVRNRCERRVLAVLSVDGLSVMDGKEAKFDSGGYIIEPYDYVDVPGWRLNLSETARFIFAKAAESYATQTGRPGNVGVIGLALFREAQSFTLRSCRYPASFNRFPPPSPYCSAGFDPAVSIILQAQTEAFVPGAFNVNCCATPEASQQAPSHCFVGAGVEPATPELGTGFGEAVQHRVNSTTFNRESSSPNELLEVFYDSKEGLRRRGVDLDKKPTVAGPQPFPGQGFCPPPGDWSR
jgi:hypothetical protein